MAIYDLYSKRKRREEGNYPDVYQYVIIPEELRRQIVFLWLSTIGPPEITTVQGRKARDLYTQIDTILRREYGLFHLTGRDQQPFASLRDFLLTESRTDRILDVIELTFTMIDKIVRKESRHYNSDENPDDAIKELNQRFQEHGCGYQYESGKIIRIDSQMIHSEIVKPVLLLLSDPQFSGANQEFLNAHEHFRHKNCEECLVECQKAFESTMKIICDKRKWAYDRDKATAKPLIEILISNHLIPSFMLSHFSGLRSVLEGGIPTTRNRLGAHGDGATTVDVPESIVTYTLHLTAATILFLMRAEKEMN